MTSVQARQVAVVLAGGTSRRFGRDKLDEPLAAEASSLLDASLAALPASLEVVVVGPSRPTARPVRFVREDPPGGGPAAALVTGLRHALALAADVIAVLPADAPRSGRAALELLRQLADRPDVSAVVGADEEGREQPLQLALEAAAAARLVAAAPDGGHGASARGLLRSLEPAAVLVALPPDVLYDIDTPAQLAAWRAQSGTAVEAVLARLAAAGPRADGGRPVVALAGERQPERSTLAEALRLRTAGSILRGPDLLDRRRLSALVATPGGLVVLDGVVGADPPLADLVDVSVLVTGPGPDALGALRTPGAEAFDLVVLGSEIGDVDSA